MKIIISYHSSQETYDTIMELESNGDIKVVAKKPNYRVQIE